MVGPNPSPTVKQVTQQDEWYDRQLAAARAAFPEWDIIESMGGFVALPQGTEMVSGITLDGLVKKLREHAGA
jgi:hypothetical protein